MEVCSFLAAWGAQIQRCSSGSSLRHVLGGWRRCCSPHGGCGDETVIHLLMQSLRRRSLSLLTSSGPAEFHAKADKHTGSTAFVQPCAHTFPMASLPYAADAESPLKPDELRVLQSQYEKEGEFVGLQTKFNYAWGLIKSSNRLQQQEGVRLLSEIFRNSPERRRECLYYLALGNYKLGSYAEARRYNELLLDLEPENLQASSLKGLIDDKVQKEGLVGAAIVGGAVALAAVAGSLLLKGGRRR